MRELGSRESKEWRRIWRSFDGPDFPPLIDLIELIDKIIFGGPRQKAL